MIFLICNGLNNARDSLINGKLYKSIGVISINEIKDWTKLKGESKWININNLTIQKIQHLQNILHLRLKL